MGAGRGACTHLTHSFGSITTNARVRTMPRLSNVGFSPNKQAFGQFCNGISEEWTLSFSLGRHPCFGFS